MSYEQNKTLIIEFYKLPKIILIIQYNHALTKFQYYSEKQSHLNTFVQTPTSSYFYQVVNCPGVKSIGSAVNLKVF